MIKTGITTDTKFREAVNANGANVKASSVPKTLKDALSTFGKEVSYNIINENVLKTVNSEDSSSDTFIPTFVMRTNNNYGSLNNILLVGADREGFFPEEFWENSDDGFLLKEGIEIYLDGAQLEDVSYMFDRGFSFSLTDGIAAALERYPDGLTNCPVQIKAAEGALVFNGKKSAAVDINELYNVENEPYWLVKTDEEYTELNNNYNV